jgi:Rab5 GDP/GTP exchange factor
VPTQTFGEDARRLLQKTGDTISKPLSAIGRLLVEAEESLASLAPFDVGREHEPSPSSSRPQTPGADPAALAQQRAPYKPRVRRVPSPAAAQAPYDWDTGAPEDSPTRPRGPHTNRPLVMGPSQPVAPRAQVPRVQSLVQTERDAHAHSPHVSRTPTPNLDIVGMQAEIDRVHENAASASRETLRQIFPAMDQEIMDLVLEANGGDLGKSIEALLEMSSGT